MSRGRSELRTEALLLRSTPYRDADRIVTLFTERLGKVSAVARSARSSRKRFGGTLEPFVHMHASLVMGGSDLHNLREVEPIQAFSRIASDLERLTLAAAALRLVRELAPAEQPEPEMFVALLRLLTLADHEPAFDRTVLLAFAMHVLGVAGTAPSLSTCVRCGAEAPEGRAVTLDARAGALRCRHCGGAEHTLDGATRAWLEACLTDWLKQAAQPLDAPQSHAARKALSAFIAAHVHPELGSILRDDAPLPS